MSITAHDVFEAMNDWNGMSFVHQEAAGDMCGYIARRLNDAAAPPTPSAPGVAELLAECRKRMEINPHAYFPCDRIVRLLAPGGGQS